MMTNSAVMKQRAYTKDLTLIDRFKDYMKENGPMIAAGMLAMQGDTSAWRLFVKANK